jgi:hypothetical protein
MIKDATSWRTWESQGPLREPLDPNRVLVDATFERARSMGAFPPPDPLAGLDAKIFLARIVNVHAASGTDRSGS